MLGSFITFFFLVIFTICIVIWLGTKIVHILIRHREIRYIFFSIVFVIFTVIGSYYLWKKYQHDKIEQKFCLEAQSLTEEQLYQRAMASYFQGIKEQIIFQKSDKRILAESAKRYNATYNLFVLNDNIRNFDDLQNHFKVQIENPDNTYAPNRKGAEKILEVDSIYKNMSYGSVVILTKFSKVQDNIDVENTKFYQQSNNKYSFLFTVDARGYGAQQEFYSTDCCKIIPRADALKTQDKQRKLDRYVFDVPQTEYFLLVSDGFVAQTYL
ncbi:hypothetical protein [Acinetobacter ursingii]|uniref:hypothetical protein n=1 Tax=Acinetobacter ursingii TaxID=108980 RepID=UPI0021CD6D92|nr:hypothetical protein [Acinetobacter ursingii]MCU4483775.1 hypothetical protein [Acinetobacter ursingii]MCU4508095.1 hypothetical protein [Acinetobacter ursingii]